MKVLYLDQRDNLEPWFSDVVRAVGEAHDVTLYDPRQSLEAQLAEVGVVVDQGGAVGSRATVVAAARAGVKLWQVLGTGLDHVDVQFILDQGLRLANTPGPFSSIALAEHALFLMLYWAKQFPESQRMLHKGRFYQPINGELDGATLGLVGLGASARELARRASAFGMHIIGVDIQPPPSDVLKALGITLLGGPEALVQVLGRADYVSIHVPLSAHTRHMLDARALALMRPDAVLINVARGGVVDQEALIEALRAGTLRGAGLDVFATEPLDPASPLLRLANVVLTPHVAGVTTGTSRRRAGAVADNVQRIAAGLSPLYSVTGPD